MMTHRATCPFCGLLCDDLVVEPREGVPHDRRVVLAVDHCHNACHQALVLISSSIRAVYFSNSSVVSENWMIFSWPWNG